MRLTLLTVGSRGDVQPFVALGAGLARAGHEVRLATHPRYERLVTGAGLEFAPLAEGHLSRGTETAAGRAWIEKGSYRLPTWVGFLRDARSVADRRLADAAAACEGAQAIVASNLAFVLGWQMADHLRVPLVRAYIEPPAWMFPSKRRAARLAPAIRQVAWAAAKPWLDGVRRRAIGIGRVPLREPFAGLDRSGSLVLYAFSREVLDPPATAGRRAEVTGYWFTDTTFDPEPPPGLEAFLADGAPPVSIGFATMIDPDPAASTAFVVKALALAGRRAVLIRGDQPIDAAALPDEVFVIDTVSHAWLFPRCAAAVHYAPAGTTAAALRAGIPSVTIPHMTDQFLWARRLHELGVAPEPIPRLELTAERLGEAIRVASGGVEMRGRAAALGQRIRAEDGVGRAVELIGRELGVPPPGPGAPARAERPASTLAANPHP
ncbi:glycosyltransferase family 1 protein [Baekduia soli]|uniref:Glycosyltransferase family 1 protein n=1 Tax=Baekduia soli TaxID=496014 RepID=A0A5B8U5E0_9ACTN|nr:glycosyltransferase [Baekduia soli]QEC48336.1 glycosyltransferase family 1 protein [Baekduia soli]